MATSGVIYTSYSNNSRFYLKWQLADQDIENNRSLIKWQAGLDIDGAFWWGTNAVTINSIHINGGGSLGSGTWSNISGDGLHQLKSGSKWINHDADGSKSFSADISGWLYANGNKSASGSWDLTTIPRNSQVTTDASSYVLGNPITIKTNRKSGSFTHTINIRQANSTGTIIHTFNSVGSSVIWTPSSTEITQMEAMIPNTNKLVLYIDQYNNQVKEHSDVSVTLNIADANPLFTSFTYKDSSSTATITGNNQVLVKGKSTLEVDIVTANKMTAVKSATANHYSIAYDGSSELENYSAIATVSSSFATIATIGTRTIQVTAYDSRNNATKASQDVVVYDYFAPTISTTLERENNFGTDTTIHIEGTYTPLVIGGANKNSLTTSTLQYRYQEDGGTFGSWVPVTFTTDTTNGTFAVTDFVVSLDNTKKYNFEFHINDSFGQVTSVNSVDVGNPIMFTGQLNGETAIGINKMPEQGTLDVQGDIYSNDLKVATYDSNGKIPVSDVDSTALPAFAAASAGVTGVPTTVYANVPFTILMFDTAGAYDLSTSTYTIPIDGLYEVNYYFQTLSIMRLYSAININNSSNPYRTDFLNTTTTNLSYFTRGNAIYQLNAGDEVNVQLYAYDAGDISSGTGWSQFSVHKIT